MTKRVSQPLKVARGTARKDRGVSAPASATNCPHKPEWLGPIASEKWDEVVAHLESENQLLPIYGDFIGLYCQAFEDMRNAEAVIEVEGEYCMSEKGARYQHPAVGVKNKAIERMAKFGNKLGMNGASTVQKTK